MIMKLIQNILLIICVFTFSILTGDANSKKSMVVMAPKIQNSMKVLILDNGEIIANRLIPINEIQDFLVKNHRPSGLISNIGDLPVFSANKIVSLAIDTITPEREIQLNEICVNILKLDHYENSIKNAYINSQKHGTAFIFMNSRVKKIIKQKSIKLTNQICCLLPGNMFAELTLPGVPKSYPLERTNADCRFKSRHSPRINNIKNFRFKTFMDF